MVSRPQSGWAWSIFATATGKPVAELHVSVPGAPFFLLQHRLCYETPAEAVYKADRLTTVRRVVAIDLATGVEVWAAPIRETGDLGPYPGEFPAAPR
jgi:hypothetical protein